MIDKLKLAIYFYLLAIALRIVPQTGFSEGQGVVEVYYNYNYHPVCLSGFNITLANIICKQLGFAGDGSTFSGHKNNTQGYSNINFIGNESIISQCYQESWNLNNCYLNETVYVKCKIEVGKM